MPATPQKVFTKSNPAESCKAIYGDYSDAESGFHWIKNQQALQSECTARWMPTALATSEDG